MKTSILFLHAFPLNAEMWKNQIEYFSQINTGISCSLAPNLPGFGSNQLPHHPLTFEFYVDHILDYLIKNNLKNSIWCGLSMGGYLALRLYERAPEMCKGLILSDTKASPDGNEAKLRRWHAIMGLHSDFDLFLANQWRALIGESSQKNQKLKDQFNQLILKSTKEGISSGLVALATRTDTTDQLSKICVPTLIIVGDEDKVTPTSDAEFLHKNIKNSTLRILKGCGHLANIEQPDLFNKEVLHFLIQNKLSR
jgi:pimeloyl-ACP methyl ester carboxylesterase